MANIFLSHSSRDKELVFRLAADLVSSGHDPWLDAWEIKVGECIPSKIEQGIVEADFVAIVLSKSAAESQWVDREWKAKYWEEVSANRVALLPVLVEDCEIPPLLKMRKYADFRVDYEYGLSELLAAINALLLSQYDDAPSSKKAMANEVSHLLLLVQGREEPLSKCVAGLAIIADRIGDDELKEYCAAEMTGWNNEVLRKQDRDRVRYRKISGYYSVKSVNPGFVGWGGNIESSLDYMKSDPAFVPSSFFIPTSISEIESQVSQEPNRKIIQITIPSSNLPLSDRFPPEVFFYASGDSYRGICNGLRSELSKILLELDLRDSS